MLRGFADIANISLVGSVSVWLTSFYVRAVMPVNLNSTLYFVLFRTEDDRRTVETGFKKCR